MSESENEQYPIKKQHSKEEKSQKPEATKKKEEHRHCQCLSPKKETQTILSDNRSPSVVREDKEVFDFTSKKLSHPSSSGTLSRKSRSKENKVDITRKEQDSHSPSMSKSPRRKDERNVFDFSVADGSEYATLRRKKKQHNHSSQNKHNREVLDFTSSTERQRQELMEYGASGSERKDLSSRLDTSVNTSQEMLHNIKSSSEFLISKSNSKEVIQKVRHAPEIHDKALDPWPESAYLSLPRQKSDNKKDDYDSLGDSTGDNKEDVSNRDTIDPPDLFNTNKSIAQNDDIEQELAYDNNSIVQPRNSFYKDENLSIIQNDVIEEPIYVSRSATLKHR